MKRHRIVVGVDGSANADVALSWAYEQAKDRRAALDIVNVWSTPALADIAAMASERAFVDLEARAKSIVDDAVARVIGHPEGITVRRIAVPGFAPAKLVELADGANLLVVGTRGHNALSDLMLGSLGGYCADRATCPVVIIPPADRVDRDALEHRKTRLNAQEDRLLVPARADVQVGEGELA